MSKQNIGRSNLAKKAKEMCLYSLCLQRTAQLIKSHYWDADSPFGYNPFRLMPSAIVDSLILYLLRLCVYSLEPFLQSSDLYLLLTSGQVREFVLGDIRVPAEHLAKIFLDLASACQKVIKVKIKDVSVKGRMNFLTKKRHALNLLLSKARNVRYVESWIEFDLKVLCRSDRLEKLVLNFPVKDRLFDFLQVDGELMPNYSLKCLEVFEDPRHKVKYEDIAVIMRYCLELREINCDISKSLEYLHAEELFNGTLSTQYKIEKCRLGCDYVSGKEPVVSRDGVCIVSLTCLQLRDISMLVSDDKAILALKNFKNLENLLIQWGKLLDCGDYTLGVQLLLEEPNFGRNLACLSIFRFTNVDFASIGACCPNLIELKVEYDHAVNEREFSPQSFKKLKYLHLESIDDHSSEAIIGLLSCATDLISVALLDEGRLTDEVLKIILKKNSLSKLMYLGIFRCALSIDGIRNLVSSCKALQYFHIGEPVVNSDEIHSIVNEINPLVKVEIRTINFYNS